MILESIVTSVDAEGTINLAPMGPVIDWDPTAIDPIGQTIILRPFDSSRTFANLQASLAAVVHVTDDAALFARAAVTTLSQKSLHRLLDPIAGAPWWKLRDCHRWFAVRVESISDDRPRVEVACRIEKTETVRPFFGFNRARHAIIEAAILATRIHLIPEEEIRAELDRLQPLIDKTGGAEEHDAMKFLREKIAEQLHG